MAGFPTIDAFLVRTPAPDVQLTDLAGAAAPVVARLLSETGVAVPPATSPPAAPVVASGATPSAESPTVGAVATGAQPVDVVTHAELRAALADAAAEIVTAVVAHSQLTLVVLL